MRRWLAATRTVTAVAAVAVLGVCGGSDPRPTGEAGTIVALADAGEGDGFIGVAAAPDGTVFASLSGLEGNEGTTVRAYEPDGGSHRRFHGDEHVVPAALAYDHRRDRLYAAQVTASDAVWILEGERHARLLAGDFEEKLAALDTPSALAVDPGTGAVYVADTQNARVLRIAGGKADTVAGTGMRGFSGDAGPARVAMLEHPTGLAYDGDRRVLYIADGARIRRVDADGTIATVAGDGQTGSTGDDGPAANARLGYSLGLTFDQDRDALYVADPGHHRVRRIDTRGGDHHGGRDRPGRGLR
jgi:hypothetical protein